VEDARPLASMIHNGQAGILAKEMLLLSISKDIVEGIIHQLYWIMIKMMLKTKSL
jgi:hypothetical protein